nr:reverse transcriptase domain-containing protein [Tanacetum cinerariifolium]
MIANFFQMNTASTSGSGPLLSNTIANPKGELKAITTRSGLFLDGPSVLMPPPFINPKEDERAEETLTDPELPEYTIKVPPPFVQKAKPHSLRNYVQEKDEIQIHKFWQMFKQLHINITLADALIIIPKYQKMLKALLSNKKKLLELANTPLNENCSAVILKKLPEKLGDPGKFLIPCGFRELKCKALADLGASINLMPLSVWKKLGLLDLISTRMTLELANRAIYTPAGIARDVFVPVGKFTFLADFVIVDYESDPRVPLILGISFLRTARGLINVHGEEMILRDGDERLTLNMRHDTSSYSNQPHKESINMINIYNDSYEDYLEDFGNTTSSFPDHLLEEFANELVLITFPLENDDLSFDIESDLKEIEYLRNHNPTKEMDSILEDSVDECNLVDPNNDLVAPDKNVKKISISNASLILEDFNPPLYELPFHKEVLGRETLLSFSSENEEKVFNLEILTSKGVHTSLLLKLSHRGPKSLKVIKNFESPMEIFSCSYGEDIHILDVSSGSKSRPPMLNKKNYVPWLSRLLRYAKSRPNGMLIHNSILNGPYVRKIIHEPGDANRDITITETFHLQTDDELSDKEIKQIEADDQAIQTILFGLPEDIYAAVDSCEIAQEIWLRVQQIMKGSDIRIQEKKAKLFNE